MQIVFQTFVNLSLGMPVRIDIMIKEIINFPNRIYNKIILSWWNVVFENPPKINGRISIGGKGKVIVGNKVTINSSHRSNPVGSKERSSIHVAKGAVVKIGDNVGISNSLLYAWEAITIEDDVMIGGGCQIYDTDFHSLNYEDRVLNGDNKVKVSPVIIKKGAFIGASSIILKGVTVGEKSIVAAGSVVAKSIPGGEIWGGNPARFIKKIEE